MESIVLGFLLIHLALLLGIIAALILTLVSRGGPSKSGSGCEELDPRGRGLLGISNICPKHRALPHFVVETKTGHEAEALELSLRSRIIGQGDAIHQGADYNPGDPTVSAGCGAH